MEKEMKNILVILLVLCILGCTTTETKQNQTPRYDANSYLNELKRVENRSKDADFFKLRMAYTGTENYAPYTDSEPSRTNEAFDRLKQKEFDKCLEIADGILNSNFTSLNGHYLAMACNFELNREDEGEYHRFVLKGLIDSIASNGDGRSIETAYTTISVAELRAFLQMMGLEVKKQSL